MKYRLILVDDEQLELEWLCKIIQESCLNLEIVSVVNNAFQALEVISKEKIDILISDIKMPIMTGLELAKNVRKINPSLKIIFISGYQSFEYAKQAISINVISYLLKPVVKNELIDVLQEVINQIDQERLELEQKNRLQQAMPMVKTNMIQQILTNSQRDKIDSRLLEQYGIIFSKEKKMIAAIEVDDINIKLKNYKRTQREQIMHNVMILVTEFVEEFKLGYSCKLDSAHMILLLEFDDYDTIIHNLQRLLSKVKETSPLTITIGLGNSIINEQDLPLSYDQASNALEHKMLLGKSKIITFGHIPENKNMDSMDMDEKVKELFQYIVTGNEEMINQNINEIFNIINNYETKKKVFNLAVYIVSKIDNCFEHYDKVLYNQTDWKFEDLAMLSEFETIEDIKNWLLIKIKELTCLLINGQSDENRKIIDEIKTYVCEHLEEKITLRDISAYFAFSPNYLGFLFKKETGENFTDFFIKQKMERACDYLLNPRMKIYEVAEKLNYKNIIYFNRQFKEAFGISPSDFRKKNKV